tara:strand:+ start:2687 stop:3097 length:411 start_codon:yes stop_codon:yes gene_type:complete
LDFEHHYGFQWIRVFGKQGVNMAFRALLSVLGLLLFSSALQGQIVADNVFVVEVVGEGSGGKQSTFQQVEQQARQDAMRQAVEQAGVYLESNTQVDMAMLTKDEIQSWSQGLVKVLEVLDTKTDYDSKMKAFRCEM